MFQGSCLQRPRSVCRRRIEFAGRCDVGIGRGSQLLRSPASPERRSRTGPGDGFGPRHPAPLGELRLGHSGRPSEALRAEMRTVSTAPVLRDPTSCSASCPFRYVKATFGANSERYSRFFLSSFTGSGAGEVGSRLRRLRHSSRLGNGSLWRCYCAARWNIARKAQCLQPSEVRGRDRLPCRCLFLLDGLFEILDGGRFGGRAAAVLGRGGRDLRARFAPPVSHMIRTMTTATPRITSC